MKCEICLKEFESFRGKRTCSKKCEYLLKGKITRKKLEIVLSIEEYDNLKTVLSWGYVKDITIICYHANLTVGKKVIHRYINQNKELLELYKKTICFLPTKVQKLSYFNYKSIIDDLHTLSYQKISKKWNINIKTINRICIHNLGKKPNIFENKISKYTQEKIKRKCQGSKNETYIEKIIRAILLTLNIEFIQEKYILNKKYRVDFIIGNNIIEVNGDYWHGYNKDYNEMDDMVKKLVNNYKEKILFIKEKGFNLLEIWEHEINNDLFSVIEKIKNYVKN